MDDKILEGTTTVGITCKDGVVFASERRASMGNLVAHKVAEKIFKIDDHIVTTIAGSVGDAQSLMKVIEAEVSLYQMRNNETGEPALRTPSTECSVCGAMGTTLSRTPTLPRGQRRPQVPRAGDKPRTKTEGASRVC